MWEYFYAKRVLGLDQHDMLNSLFAFPRLPPRANPPLGISNAGRIKDEIVNDKDLMMNKLHKHHEMFQHYASSLFNMSTSQFVPGHPMYARMQMIETLQEENKKLRQENFTLKTDKSKEKKA